MMFCRNTRLAIGLGLVPFAGCTAIADLGQYRRDEGCDLTMRFTKMEAHSGIHDFEIFVVPNVASADPGIRTRAAIAVLEPTPAASFELSLPRAVPDHRAVADFFADLDMNGVYNPLTPMGGRADHPWTEERLCATGGVAFEHNIDFDDFPASIGIGEDLVLELGGFVASGATIETLVLAPKPGTSELRTVAFHRLGVASDDDPTIRIEQALDRGVDYRIELFVDRNGDGLVQDAVGASDEAYVFELSPGTTLPAAGPIPLSPAGASSIEHSGVARVRILP